MSQVQRLSRQLLFFKTNMLNFHLNYMQYRRVLGLFFCLIITGLFATYKLLESPGTWFDEGIFIQLARNLSTHHAYVLRESPTQVVSAGVLATVGFPVIAPVSLNFRLFGVGLLQARTVMVIYILLMISALYLFAYSVWGFRAAMWTTLIVASHAPVYGNGKNVLGEVPGLFFFFVLLYLLSRLERRKDATRALWIGVGLTAGTFMATKPNFVLLLPVMGAMLILQRKRLALSWDKLVCGLVALAIPIGVNLLLQFGLTTSILSSLRSYAHMPGLQQLTGLTLTGLIQKNALLFIQQSTPAYLLLTAAIWIAYVGVRYRRKISIPLHELIALGFVAVTVAYFLKMPGFFRYLFVAQVITFPYFVVSCLQLVPSFTTSWLTKRKLNLVLVTVLTIMIMFQSYQVLFSSWVAGHYQSTRSKELTAYFQQLDPSKHVFFYHAPEAVTFFPHENYSQYFKLLYYNDAFGKTQLTSLHGGAPDIVILANSLEMEAQGLLEQYKTNRTIDQGRYIIFERNK